MVELVRQRRQRAALGPADRDLVDQVTGQRLGQHPARHPQQLQRRLPVPVASGSSSTASRAAIPACSASSSVPCPASATPRRPRNDLTDHHRQLLSLLSRWGQLRRGGLDGGRHGPAQRPLLIGAQHQGDQLLAASIGDQPDQPPQQIIYDKDHASSLPLLWPAVQTWCK